MKRVNKKDFGKDLNYRMRIVGIYRLFIAIRLKNKLTNIKLKVAT